ncbi:MAG TPA: VOC family protein [Candidatus Saccharimonadales bacterium]|nr:VOC family protein [Candidatus Saccharimonadales bacterium]
MDKMMALTGIFVAAIGMVVASSSSSETPKRPGILGIAFVQIESSSPESEKFYNGVLRLPSLGTGNCIDFESQCYFINPYQHVEIVKRENPSSKDLIHSVGLYTRDVKSARAYLLARGYTPGDIVSDRHGATYFEVRDPEKHRLFIVAFPKGGTAGSVMGGPLISSKLIHAGWVVQNREAMDKFYKDALGFHLYWQGGMKDGRADWVSMQVPDGTDWIEYMLNIPPDADKHLLGVMNHIALGVPSVQAAAEQLKKNGVKLTEEPKIGRDGKWQLNLYDPDGTRVELMEFTPVEKPCCSEFTGTHPKP